METRVVKNVCGPAVLLGERIVIVGGESEGRLPGMAWRLHGQQRLRARVVVLRDTPDPQGLQAT